jgi:hypothetical protein
VSKEMGNLSTRSHTTKRTAKGIKHDASKPIEPRKEAEKRLEAEFVQFEETPKRVRMADE